MREEQGIIHGLELQGRALIPVAADTESISFLVGTQSLRHTNMLYKVVLDEETGQLGKKAYRMGLGEVWHMDASPENLSHVSCTYGERAGPSGWRRAAAILNLPEAGGVGDGGEGDEVGEVEVRASLDPILGGGEPTSVTFQPNQASKVACLVGDRLVLGDLGEENVSKEWSTVHSVRGQTRVAAARFNPHRNCHEIATACGSQVTAWDSRAGTSSWQLIHSSSSQGNIRSLDFNPNKQYLLATAGDDGMVVVWDTRETKSPLHSSVQHNHWVWSVRYNSFHDQLLLSSGSDSRVVVASLASLSSEPCGHLVEGEEGSRLEDGLVQVWTEHEDSVYTAEWSTADPWTFASLSYDGRLVLGHVPQQVKFSILNLG